MFCNKNFTQSFPETLQITLILQENKQYGQTAQKLKVGQNSQKLIKKMKTAWKWFSLPTTNKEVLNKTLYQICPKTLQITQN